MSRNVLITGASHGIGAGLAVAFAKEGYNVGINYCKDREGAEQTARCVRDYGATAEIYGADVSDCIACERMLAAFIGRFDGIDVLINNAGGALRIPPGGFAEMPMSYWDAQIRLNLNAAAYCSRPAVKDMIGRGVRGKIINISSIHSQISHVRRKMLPYCAAKAGLNMFTRALAVEIIKYGINVNCIAPGLIQTQAITRYSDAEIRAFKRKIPAGIVGTVDDIAPLALLLADDAKSRFIVGQTFVVDGGQSIDGAIESMIQS